ncbi:hypothetical protein GPJ81_25320 [Pseudomonas alkylphenolica]|uniref:Uncharacterized protein n=1 Tax=Pseudomonas alkylphenolica TaxID=237609 RepID=A0A6I6GZ80_9PSED|nr:hypothetical protein [Pseudomonas alkylphenolica]QGW79890.1 hypothetical protein GPJ81_25320 [Pseudomonas alkylphenolica]
MNYFAVHKQSNVILRVIHSAVTPNNTADLEFYPAAKGRVSQYQARLKNDAPIGIYSILPQPVIPDVLPLTPELEQELREYVSKHHRQETVEWMAYKWRVSEQTVSDILVDMDNDE